MKKIQKNYSNFSLKEMNNFIKFLFIIILIGSIIGSFFSNYLNFEDSINNLNIIKENNISYFEYFLKNFKYLIIIWFLGFINFGAIFIFSIVLFKGFSLGFTTSYIFKYIGLEGFKYIFTYVPQNLIIVPMYIFVSYYAINNISLKNKKHLQSNYFYLAIAIFIFSILISLFDYLAIKFLNV